MDSFAAFEVSAVVQNSKQSITAASIWGILFIFIMRKLCDFLFL